MSLLNGFASAGDTMNALATNALTDQENARPVRPSLLNSAPPVAVAAPAVIPAVATQPASTPSPVVLASIGKGVSDLSSIKPDLTRIVAPGGAKFTVAKSAADKFLGLITDLEAAGYKIDPTISGGYNPRMIAGTNIPSLHSYGLAIDLNSERNQQGDSTPSDIPADLARALAAKYGLTWGGDWRGKTRDPMHFEVAGARPDSGAT